MNSRTELILMVLCSFTLVFAHLLNDDSPRASYEGLKKVIETWNLKPKTKPTENSPVKEPGQGIPNDRGANNLPHLEPSKAIEEELKTNDWDQSDTPVEEPGQVPQKHKENDALHLEIEEIGSGVEPSILEPADFAIWPERDIPVEEPGQEPPKFKDIVDIPHPEPSKTVEDGSYIWDWDIPVEEPGQKHVKDKDVDELELRGILEEKSTTAPTGFSNEPVEEKLKTEPLAFQIEEEISIDSSEASRFNVEFVRFCVLVASVLIL